MDKKRMKPKMMLLAAAVASLSPIGAIAQEGLFHRGVSAEAYYGHVSKNGMFDKSGGNTEGNLTGQGFGATGANLTGQTFNAPLGSGLFVMLAAGAGYVTIKSRKKQNKQNRKGK